MQVFVCGPLDEEERRRGERTGGKSGVKRNLKLRVESDFNRALAGKKNPTEMVELNRKLRPSLVIAGRIGRGRLLCELLTPARRSGNCDPYEERRLLVPARK